MIDLDYGVKLITRAEWGAKPPTSTTPLDPSFGSTRHWEGPHMGTFPHSSCAAKVRGIQDFHMGPDRGWTDIAYTGVVCPHRYVFEGRGLFRRTAANGTATGNNTAYAFCYLGGEGDPFTEDGKAAMKAAMNWTRAHGGAGAGRNDHNDWKATACPGTEIEAWGDSGEIIEEDDVSAEEVWNFPIKNALKPEGANMDPARELLTFAHSAATQAVSLIEALSDAVMHLPDAVWDAEVFEQINEVNLQARQLLNGAHYWAYVGVNGPPEADAEPLGDSG